MGKKITNKKQKKRRKIGSTEDMHLHNPVELWTREQIDRDNHASRTIMVTPSISVGCTMWTSAAHFVNMDK
jgi:hypothetical protein